MSKVEKKFGFWILALCALSGNVSAFDRNNVVKYALGQQDARPVLNAIRKYSVVQHFPEEESVRRLTTFTQPGEAIVIRCEDVLIEGLETPIVSCDIEVNFSKKVTGVDFIEGRFGTSYLVTLSDAALTKPFAETFARFPYESATRVYFRDPNRGGALVSFPTVSIECVQGLPSCWLALVKE